MDVRGELPYLRFDVLSGVEDDCSDMSRVGREWTFTVEDRTSNLTGWFKLKTTVFTCGDPLLYSENSGGGWVTISSVIRTGVYELFW